VEYKTIHQVPNGQIGKGGSTTIHKVTWLGKGKSVFIDQKMKISHKKHLILQDCLTPIFCPCFVMQLGIILFPYYGANGWGSSPINGKIGEQ
jgi:hypothetical protein